MLWLWQVCGKTRYLYIFARDRFLVARYSLMSFKILWQKSVQKIVKYTFKY